MAITVLARYIAERHGVEWAAIRRAHRISWKWTLGGVHADGVWRTGPWGRSVKDTGFDATCSCGWESRTGGAMYASVQRAIAEHFESIVLDIAYAKEGAK